MFCFPVYVQYVSPLWTNGGFRSILIDSGKGGKVVCENEVENEVNDVKVARVLKFQQNHSLIYRSSQMNVVFFKLLVVLLASTPALAYRHAVQVRAVRLLQNWQSKLNEVDVTTNKIRTLCPTLNIIDTESEIYKLAVGLESSRHAIAPNMKLQSERARLNGLWRTLATSLKMAKLVSFSQVIMAKVDKQLDNQQVEIENLYQYINFDDNVYDNYVAIKGLNTNIAVVTRGCASYNEGENPEGAENHIRRNNRLTVTFTQNNIVPFSPTKVSEASFIKQRQAEDETESIRRSLHLPNDVQLKVSLNVKGWSDCTYLSEDGRIRIMRGNNQNIYILERAWIMWHFCSIHISIFVTCTCILGFFYAIYINNILSFKWCLSRLTTFFLFFFSIKFRPKSELPSFFPCIPSFSKWVAFIVVQHDGFQIRVLWERHIVALRIT